MELACDRQTWIYSWKEVVFSNENKFNLDGPERCQYYWSDPQMPEEISAWAGGGEPLMVWAAIGYCTKMALQFIDWCLNAEGFILSLKIVIYLKKASIFLTMIGFSQRIMLPFIVLVSKQHSLTTKKLRQWIGLRVPLTWIRWRTLGVGWPEIYMSMEGSLIPLLTSRAPSSLPGQSCPTATWKNSSQECHPRFLMSWGSMVCPL